MDKPKFTEGQTLCTFFRTKTGNMLALRIVAEAVVLVEKGEKTYFYQFPSGRVPEYELMTPEEAIKKAAEALHV